MKKTKTRALHALTLATLLTLIACGANDSSQSRLDRAMAKLNQKEYGEARRLLDEEQAAAPTNKNIALLRAQAHLGESGFEMFEFVEAVMAKQDSSSYVELVAPLTCSDEAITKVQGQDFRCLLQRVLQRLPDADHPHFASARRILREHFPVASQSSTDVNFLAAFVELGSALSRTRAILSKSAWTDRSASRSQVDEEDLRFKFVLGNMKKFFTELSEGFRRARYSYKKLNQYVVTFDGKPLIKVGDNTLAFNEQLGIPAIAGFMKDVLGDSSRRLDDDLSDTIAGQLDRLGPGFVRVLSELDVMAFSGETQRRIQVAWRFERAIQKAISSIADSSEKNTEINLVEHFWQAPPQILLNFSQAIEMSWETESIKPLRDYYSSTQKEWKELEDLQIAWNRWFNDSLSSGHRAGILNYLKDLKDSDPRFAPPPAHMTAAQIGKWQKELVASLSEALIQIIEGKVTEIPRMNPSQGTEGLNVLFRTQSWTTRNLW